MKKIFLFLLVLISVPLFSQVTRTTVNPGNWTNPATWDTGVPNTGDDVIINHSIFINTKDTVNNITINQTTFCSDTLFITGVLNLEDDIFSSPIVLVNNQTYKGRLGQTSNGQIIGDFIWQKWIARCDGWGTYGGPFNAPLSSYGFFHTGFAGTAWPNFWANTYFYDETASNQPRDTGWYVPSNVNDILTRGQGFLLFDSSSSVTNDPRVIELSGSIDLNQDVDYNITYNGNPNNMENGWNLIANPYPGSIDWDAVGWTKTRVDNAIWVWNVCSKNYASYINGIGVNGGSRYISSGQGFWVRGNKNNTSLVSNRNVIVDNNLELLKQGTQSSGLIRLSLGDDEIAVSINSSATNSYDSIYDCMKFKTSGTRIYSQIDTTEYAINSIYDEDTIAIYVNGDGILSFDLNELGIIQDVFYEDLQSGFLYDANINPQYAFTSSSNGFYHRFNLIIPSLIFSVEEHNNNTVGKLLNRVNILGQPVNDDYEGIVIEYYSNGVVKKVFKNN